MDWIRRNWPDLLIGLALLAVIAGIIATLLTGGSFFPLRQSGQPSSNGRQNDPGNQTIVGSRTPGSSETRTGSSSAPNQSEQQSENTGTASGNPVGSSDLAADGGEGASSVQVTALPLPGSEDDEVSAGQSEGDDTGGQSPAVDSAPADTAPDGESAADARGPAGAVSAAAAPTASGEEAGSYRVSVGAFSSRDNAERQAQTFREAGFPVFIGEQGTLSIVLVGPFEELGEAESTAERIRSGEYDIDPVIYRFQPDEEEASPAASASPASSAAGTTGESAAASTVATEPGSPDAMQVTSSGTPAPAPTASQASGARRLQVGAYANSESAQPQIERLEDLGFRVSEVTEGNLIKLMVGPFSGDDLSEAQALLNEQGIDHFAR